MGDCCWHTRAALFTAPRGWLTAVFVYWYGYYRGCSGRWCCYLWVWWRYMTLEILSLTDTLYLFCVCDTSQSVQKGFFPFILRWVVGNLNYLCYAVLQLCIHCTLLDHLSCLSCSIKGYSKAFSLHIMFSSLLFSCEWFCTVMDANNAIYLSVALDIYVISIFSDILESSPPLIVLL